MRKRLNYLLIFAIVGFCFCSILGKVVKAGTYYPEKSGDYVNDYAKILPEDEFLSERLKEFEKKSGIEIIVVTLPSLGEADLNEYASQLYKKWRIGKENEDNGILILAVPHSQQITIYTGYGLREILSDERIQTIIGKEIVPSFHKERYLQGLKRGVEAIIQSIEGKYHPKAKTNNGITIFGTIVIFLVIFLIIFSCFGRKSRRYRRRVYKKL